LVAQRKRISTRSFKRQSNDFASDSHVEVAFVDG
jgi:hypothetical protein